MKGTIHLRKRYKEYTSNGKGNINEEGNRKKHKLRLRSSQE